jgi:hypothetical protein
VNGAITRIGALTLAAIGMVALTAGSAGAVAPRQISPPTVTVTFIARGDLKSFEGRLHDFNCVERTQPNPFQVRPFDQLRVDVQSFNSPVCTKNEAIWLLVTRPKSASDPPETMGVRLRYGSRPTTVEFLHASKDLRWVAHVLDTTHVVVEITGK